MEKQYYYEELCCQGQHRVVWRVSGVRSFIVINKEEIIRVDQEETGKCLDEIKKAQRIERGILMDLLYRAGGIKGPDMGKIMDVDYSTVRQGRKRLRARLKKDRNLKQCFERLEQKLSQ